MDNTSNKKLLNRNNDLRIWNQKIKEGKIYNNLGNYYYQYYGINKNDIVLTEDVKK